MVKREVKKDVVLSKIESKRGSERNEANEVFPFVNHSRSEKFRVLEIIANV